MEEKILQRLLIRVRNFELKELTKSLTESDHSLRCINCGSAWQLEVLPFENGQGYFALCRSCYDGLGFSKIRRCANCVYLLISPPKQSICYKTKKPVNKPYESFCSGWAGIFTMI